MRRSETILEMGSVTQIKVAPAASGTSKPSANCGEVGGLLLTTGTNSYPYPGLSPNTKYGFRFCSWDSSSVSEGATLWAETLP